MWAVDTLETLVSLATIAVSVLSVWNGRSTLALRSIGLSVTIDAAIIPILISRMLVIVIGYILTSLNQYISNSISIAYSHAISSFEPKAPMKKILHTTTAAVLVER